ncbi:TPA: hypothetical protein RFV58_005389 [Klebsiella pneumoniae subsp. pneumoniae]|nr:hypothetical protein [Klebsiella pneumoniae subsp. pneumoniae]
MDQRGIDDSALAQRQTAIPPIAIDHAEDAGCQLMFLSKRRLSTVWQILKFLRG